MLVALAIRDIVVIDRLAIDFARGMTVLTGETGAGKSILIGALNLALGEVFLHFGHLLLHLLRLF